MSTIIRWKSDNTPEKCVNHCAKKGMHTSVEFMQLGIGFMITFLVNGNFGKWEKIFRAVKTGQ